MVIFLKKTEPPKLMDAIKELNEGGAPMSSQIARKVVFAFQKTNKATLFNGHERRRTALIREKQILEELSRGLCIRRLPMFYSSVLKQ